ncbi:DUF655 domain-containing protein [Sulfuracidifex tepidarius]|uniref:RNA-binding protein n=1 Tax=Sulfuracidifex tepidarius TaxID=1294262 RepID=A0A510E571_9CREN|nr:DUF655 domain-containing protein [Sulfuracidifex tepidarius]BBG24430.1 hypothetical protein IC006_1742 [Sulfuracidifex tepidarius]BBG27188.1 hypothetical protein IC007_1720 [Sulfuracidifex tepidarius]
MQRRRYHKEGPKDVIVYVLDYMREGNPLDKHKFHSNKPIIQAVGRDFFTLSEILVQDISKEIQIEQMIDLREDNGVLFDLNISYDDLTTVARDSLKRVLPTILTDKEQEIVTFFNNAGPLTLRLHSLELIPSIGKKTLRTFLEERKRKPFESYKDIEDRTGIKDVKGLLVERIIKEMQGEEKYYLFVYPFAIPSDENKRNPEQQVKYVGYIEKRVR